jgi:protein-L-isoaspartate(D-aspartate) O-methyltransferase
MTEPPEETALRAARDRMVREQIVPRGIETKAVIEAMRRVPRHRFVPASEVRHAYRDTPLPIGAGQTISQPYMVALMTELARPAPGARALEVGTGSGYQAAVLAELVDHVYTIELEPTLGRTAEQTLRELRYDNVTVRIGDGYAGWPEHAPFELIIVTAAPDHIPPALIDQLAPGGVMVVPVGPSGHIQQLRVLEKNPHGVVRTRDVAPVRFVPLRRRKPD